MASSTNLLVDSIRSYNERLVKYFLLSIIYDFKIAVRGISNTFSFNIRGSFT